MKLTILLAGVSLLASNAWAGNVSNVAGTLDMTIVDPAPAQYPHFICATGCSGGAGAGGAVTQSGAWNVGVSNFPSTQTINGVVTVPGVATSANQPLLNLDGGALSHITNLPSIQSVSGTITIGNFPATQAITGAVAVPGVATAANQPNLNSDGGGLAHVTNFPSVQPVNGTVSIGNFPATQPINGAVSVSNFPLNQVVTGTVTVPGVATAASQPALYADGGALSHVTNLPAIQAVNGTVTVGNLPATQAVTGSVTVLGVATAVNQPGLNSDGGALAHIVNFPTTQPVSGTVTVSNLPSTQTVTGTLNAVLVDPTPTLYPHFICSSGCAGGGGGGGAVTAAAGAYVAGSIADLQALLNKTGTLNADGGGQVHVMNMATVNGDGGTQTHTMNGALEAGGVLAQINTKLGGTLTVNTISGYATSALQTSLINLFPAALGAGGGLKIDGSGTALPVNLADGAEVTLGSKADAAWTSGAGSLIAVVKALDRDTLLPLPAGSNVVGGVTVADGSDATLGSKNDAAWISGAGSVTALLKAVVASNQGAIPTGTSVIGKVGIDQTTPGTTNGVQVVAPLPAGTNQLGTIANSRQATASAPISVSTATTTQLVALSAGNAIYVSAFDFLAASANTVTLEYGTGTNCGTGTTLLTGGYPLAAQVGMAEGSGVAPVLFVPAGNALCVVTTAAVQLSGSVSYAQQP